MNAVDPNQRESMDKTPKKNLTPEQQQAFLRDRETRWNRSTLEIEHELALEMERSRKSLELFDKLRDRFAQEFAILIDVFGKEMKNVVELSRAEVTDLRRMYSRRIEELGGVIDETQDRHETLTRVAGAMLGGVFSALEPRSIPMAAFEYIAHAKSWLERDRVERAQARERAAGPVTVMVMVQEEKREPAPAASEPSPETSTTPPNA